MKKYLFLIFATLQLSFSFGQVDNEKYIFVPAQFEFLKEPNQFQLNQLTKFLFEREGFKVYYEGEEIPREVLNNPCNAFYADVKNDSGLLFTGLKVVIYDCNKNQVYATELGKSKEKSYKEAYHEALRNSFLSINGLRGLMIDDNSTISSKGNSNKILAEGILENSVVEPSISSEVVNKLSKISEEDLLRFTSGDLKFFLKKIDNGFYLFQEGAREPFAKLITTKTSNFYIYSSLNNQGLAFFDNEQNLVVEVIENGDISTKIINYLQLKN